jgi:hypothetical protein
MKQKCYIFPFTFSSEGRGTEANTVRVYAYPEDRLASDCFADAKATIQKEFKGRSVRIQSMAPME